MSPYPMSIGTTLNLLLDGAKHLMEGEHLCSLPMIELVEGLTNSDFADFNTALVAHLTESTRTYWRCFARGEDGEPAETAPQEFASEIKMTVLKLMNAHLQWKEKHADASPKSA